MVLGQDALWGAEQGGGGLEGHRTGISLSLVGESGSDGAVQRPCCTPGPWRKD
jgi:hypothetical protein